MFAYFSIFKKKRETEASPRNVEPSWRKDGPILGKLLIRKMLKVVPCPQDRQCFFGGAAGLETSLQRPRPDAQPCCSQVPGGTVALSRVFSYQTFAYFLSSGLLLRFQHRYKEKF